MNLDLINDAVKEKGLSLEQLEAISSVPKSTLARVLNGSTANPQFQTVADIAVALGLSLDDVAGIESADPGKRQQVVHHVQSAEVNMLYRSMIHERDMRIKRLTIAVVVLVLFQMFRWTVDVSNPQLGWIRLDEANTTFVSIFLIVVVVLAAVAGIVRYVMKNYQRKEE